MNVMNILPFIALILVAIPVFVTFFRYLFSSSRIIFALNADKRFYSFTIRDRRLKRAKIIKFSLIGSAIMLLAINGVSQIMVGNGRLNCFLFIMALILILIPLAELTIYRLLVNRYYRLEMTASERNKYDDYRDRLDRTPFSLNGNVRQAARFIMFSLGILDLLAISFISF